MLRLHPSSLLKEVGGARACVFHGRALWDAPLQFPLRGTVLGFFFLVHGQPFGPLLAGVSPCVVAHTQT